MCSLPICCLSDSWQLFPFNTSATFVQPLPGSIRANWIEREFVVCEPGGLTMEMLSIRSKNVPTSNGLFSGCCSTIRTLLLLEIAWAQQSSIHRTKFIVPTRSKGVHKGLAESLAYLFAGYEKIIRGTEIVCIKLEIYDILLSVHRPRIGQATGVLAQFVPIAIIFCVTK